MRIIDLINLPVDFCWYVLKNRCLNQARTFVYLKYISSGNLNIKLLDRKKLMRELEIKKWETVDRHIKWLVENNWITNNSGKITFKSYSKLCYNFGITTSRGTLFDPPIFKLNEFRAFFVATVMLFRLRRRRWIIRKFGNETVEKENFKKLKFPENLLPLDRNKNYMSKSYVAKIIGVSNSCGHNYKRLLSKHGYAKFQHNFNRIDINDALRNKELFKQEYQEITNQVIEKKHELCVQLPDIVGNSVQRDHLIPF